MTTTQFSARVLCPTFPRSEQALKSWFTRTVYKGLNAVERTSCRLKGYSRIVTGDNKLSISFLARLLSGCRDLLVMSFDPSLNKDCKLSSALVQTTELISCE